MKIVNYLAFLSIFPVDAAKPINSEAKVAHALTFLLELKNCTIAIIIKILKANKFQASLSFSGTRVVWQDNREGPWTIYWKNLITGNGGKVSSYVGSNIFQGSAAISGNKVFWQDYRGGFWAVYWKDLTNGSGGKLSNN